MTLLPLWRHLSLVALALSFSCATQGAAPEKTEEQRIAEIQSSQAKDLHAQLAECRRAPGTFCHACLNNRPRFLDETDQQDWHRICRNVVMYRHCAPGFDDPNLSVQARRAFCEEATLGQIDDAADDDDTDAPPTRTPQDPTPEELARLKNDLVKAIQKVDAEDAGKAATGTAPAAAPKP